MRVSSRHLILSSRVFAAMLRRLDFREATELRSRGAVEIALPDDNAAALLAELRAVHGRFSQAQPKVSLQELARIAIVVDKYAFHEALQLQIEKWLGSLPQRWFSPESADDADVLSALVVAWGFRRSVEYSELTKAAQHQWDGPFDLSRHKTLFGDIPLPVAIFGKTCPLLPVI
jgi:hypothetical protein